MIVAILNSYDLWLVCVSIKDDEEKNKWIKYETFGNTFEK